jgi:hydrophobe/amphiphile efflux-1 (HAE1) family protein
MISRFCIEHPIFASVISIIITLAGFAAMNNLPIQQFPNMTPPLITVTAIYNGANAETIANDVASPLEQQILGAQDMIYMYSQNSSSGMMKLQCYFDVDSNADIDQVNVQNLVNQATAQLPSSVQQQGVIVNKQTPSILLVVAMQSLSGRFDQEFISNYSNIEVVNSLELLPGISNITVIGQRNYSMRIWLKPDIMAQLKISTNDIINAVQEQNADYGVGQMGQAPNNHPVVLTIPMQTQGRLSTPEEFENIILRADPNGSFVLLKDVARVVLGAQNYTVDGAIDGVPTVLLAIYQEYGANALDVAASVYKNMEKLSKNFPEGLEYSIPYDTTKFIHFSIIEVIKTLIQAAFLVAIVVFVFLQSTRATIIPVIAMIVSISGGFAGMYLLGFSINTLTLFGMVLAVGIVVDDAIVVVENVERNLREHYLSPKEAAIKAMQEVTGPVIAIVFVLCAVFIPVAFLGGIAGALYKQFAITIAISVVCSGIVALTLSPALASLLLKPKEKKHPIATYFNTGLNWLTEKYLNVASWLMNQRIISFSIFVLVTFAVGVFFKTTPTSLVPNEDQGYVIAFAHLPDGASLDRTDAVGKLISKIATNHPGVERVVELTGFNLMNSLDITNVGTYFIMLKDWNIRREKKLQAAAIIEELNQKFLSIEDSAVFVMNPPAIQGLGTVGGFEFWIENMGEGGNKALEDVLVAFFEKAKSRPELGFIHSNAEFNNLQFNIELDRFKTKALGVSVSEVYQTLQTLLGSVYINNFNKFGRVYQVIAQAEPEYREKLQDLGNIYVRSNQNEMVPLKSLMTITPAKGANVISRFNDYPAVEIMGGPATGYTSGQAIIAMQEVAKEVLPADMRCDWSGIVYQQISTQGSSILVLGAALLIVFLILAALYEKWSLPLAVLMAVPFGVLGAFIAIKIKGLSNDIYFEIGLITLIALSAKNSILIIEFAVLQYQKRGNLFEAAKEAARLRFRAILMTSFTFIFGVLPLVTSSGAGAASRHSVGTGVMGGMISATLLALFFVPFFFTLLYRESKGARKF